MLRFLLDEHLSRDIAAGLQARRPEIEIAALDHWEGGAFLSARDDVLLTAAAVTGWTLVTYDQDTIGPLLKPWGETGADHGGVIFADQRTIAPDDFGGVIRALIKLWDALDGAGWQNRVVYLTR